MGIPMLSFWLYGNTGNTNVIFLTVWEYQCYLCWLYGNTNVIVFGCTGIPMFSLLVKC
jgi:hypothetical protein